MQVEQVSYAAFPGSEYRERHERLRGEMDARGLDAVLVTAKENVLYFAGLETVGWDSKHRPVGCILPRDAGAPILVIPESLAYVAEVTSWIDDVRLWGGFKRTGIPPDPVHAIADAIHGLGLERGRIGLELGYGTRVAMSQADFGLLGRLLDGVEVVDASDAIWALRMVKSPAEIEIMRKVCIDTCDAFQVGFEAMRGGMTERELAGIIFAEMATRTGFRPGFIGIRSGRLKYTMMNVPPFDKPLQPGDLVVVDGGAQIHDYWCDMMRMASIGEPTAEQQRFFDVDLAAQRAGMAAIKPGGRAGDVCRAALDVIQDGGLGEHVPSLERVGHGLGLDVHEPPSLALGSDVEIKPGMILTVEPIFSDLPDYRIGNFAMEQILLVTETGTELLTPFTDELWVAPVS
jgi:Xaa-Pro aminopeptidase